NPRGGAPIVATPGPLGKRLTARGGAARPVCATGRSPAVPAVMGRNLHWSRAFSLPGCCRHRQHEETSVVVARPVAHALAGGARARWNSARGAARGRLSLRQRGGRPVAGGG